LFSMEIAKAESNHFDGVLALDDGNYAKADENAYRAMLLAARALVRTRYLPLTDDPAMIIEKFRVLFYDSKLFFDPYAGGKFAHYLFDRYENPPAAVDADAAQRVIGEAQLFIEACYTCEARVNGTIVS